MLGRTRWIFYIVLFCTLFVTSTGVSIQHASQFVKLLYAGGLWMSLLLIPTQLYKNHHFDGATIKLFVIYALLVAGTIVHSIVSGQEAFVGNKWVTVLGNEEVLLMLMTPFWAFIVSDSNVLQNVKRANILFMICCLLCFLVFNSGNSSSLWYICCFAPFYKKKGKVLIFLIFLISIHVGFYAEETSRTMIVISLLALLAYVLPFVLKNKRLIRVVCVSLMVLPFIYVLPILINPEKSIITLIKGIVMDHTGNEQLANDTRTFLFKEMSMDLTNSDAWLFGKGVYSFYYSRWFDRGGVIVGRLTTEVTLLLLLLRGGILLALSYYSILYYAVYKALKNGKNMFVLSAAIMISGWIFISSFSYVNGFKFHHLCFFILVGCCLSSKWLSLSDKEINQFLK